MIDKAATPLHPHVVTKVWGGKRLAQLKNIEVEKIGETWEVSIHPDGPSKIGGKDLNQFITSKELPYLIKFIDTCDHLSVQVHPNDQYARQYENSSGKTECWLILDAGKNSGIYLGFKKNTDPKAFKESVEKGEDLTKYLKFYPVNRGDFFFVPAGSVHAIGADVFLCEIQQSSGITYRVWDWNRLGDDGKPRQLHIQKAMDVLRFENDFNDEQNFLVQKEQLTFAGRHKLINHPDFKVELINLDSDQETKLQTAKRCGALICLEGTLTSDSFSPLNAYNSLLLKEGQLIQLSANSKSSFIFVS